MNPHLSSLTHLVCRDTVIPGRGNPLVALTVADDRAQLIVVDGHHGAARSGVHTWRVKQKVTGVNERSVWFTKVFVVNKGSVC